MKILVVSNLYPPAGLGGYERECAELAAALRRRGHQLLVLTSSPRLPINDEAKDGADIVRQMRVQSNIFGATWKRRPDPARDRLTEGMSNFVDAANVHAVSDAIDRFVPDVVYLWNLHGIGALGILATVEYRGVPWVAVICDAMMVYACSLDDVTVWPLAERVSAAVEGIWTVISSRVVHETEERGVKLRGRVELVPVCIAEPEPPPPAPEYRPGEELRLVYAGVVVGFKGVGILIEALRLLRDEGIDAITLDLSGAILDRGLIDQVNRAHLEKQVYFRGALSHEASLALLSSCHLFGFATHEREPFGKAPLEAAARGCVPLISADCGIAEWLVDGVHCLKAQRRADCFADVIRRVYSGEIELGPIARRARAAALQDFDVEVIAPRVEQILGDAAADRDGLRGSTPTALRAALVAESTVIDLIEEGNELRRAGTAG